jgi:hypothetical protein
MKEKTKKTIEEAEEENYPLIYVLDKLVIIAKDNATVNIENIMSGKPKDEPRPGNP